MNPFEGLGFVSIDEIQNAFTFQMDQIEDDLKRNGPPANHVIIIEWIDQIRQELMRRARHNLDQYLLFNPQVRQAAMETRELKDAKEAHLDYKDRVAKNREKARLGEV